MQNAKTTDWQLNIASKSERNGVITVVNIPTVAY